MLTRGLCSFIYLGEDWFCFSYGIAANPTFGMMTEILAVHLRAALKLCMLARLTA